MSEPDPSPTVTDGMPVTRLVARPLRLLNDAPGQGRRVLCKVLDDCPDLRFPTGQRLVVAMAGGTHDGADLPEDTLAALTGGGPTGDLRLVLEGVRVVGGGDVPVATAHACGGRRPSRALAEAAIGDFLDREVEPGTPFQLVEDGDDDDPDTDCGWAFWVRDGDTTSYLHEGLTVEWYGTSYDPDADEEDEEDVDDDECLDGFPSP